MNVCKSFPIFPIFLSFLLFDRCKINQNCFRLILVKLTSSIIHTGNSEFLTNIFNWTVNCNKSIYKCFTSNIVILPSLSPFDIDFIPFNVPAVTNQCMLLIAPPVNSTANFLCLLKIFFILHLMVFYLKFYFYLLLFLYFIHFYQVKCTITQMIYNNFTTLHIVHIWNIYIESEHNKVIWCSSNSSSLSPEMQWLCMPTLL